MRIICDRVRDRDRDRRSRPEVAALCPQGAKGRSYGAGAIFSSFDWFAAELLWGFCDVLVFYGDVAVSIKQVDRAN